MTAATDIGVTMPGYVALMSGTFQSDFQGISTGPGDVESLLTMQNARGKKKMLTNVRSWTFSPRIRDWRVSITPLAENNCWLKSVQRFFESLSGSIPRLART